MATTKTRRAAKAPAPSDLTARLAAGERAAMALAEQLHAAANQDGVRGAGHRALETAAHNVWRAASLCWASQRYPRFDPAALQLTKPLTIALRRRDHMNKESTREVTVRAPRFGVVDYQGFSACEIVLQRLERGVKLPFGGDYHMVEVGDSPLQPGEDQSIRLSAKAPAVPETVRALVEPVRYRFQQLDVVYEAEWSVQDQAKDPLVIGTIEGHHFVVAQWDLTQMESYIAREFTG